MNTGATITVAIPNGESLALDSSWIDLQNAGDGAVFLLPVKYRTLGLGRHYLIPVGKRLGMTSLEVEISQIPE